MKEKNRTAAYVICMSCGEEFLKRKSLIKENNGIDNLIVLCANCHSLIHKDKLNIGSVAQSVER